MQQGQQKDLPASLQELEEARRIMANPNASEADKAWAAGVFGTAEDAASTPVFMQQIEEARKILRDPNSYLPEDVNWAKATLESSDASPQPTSAIQNLQMAEQILADPSSTESQRSWAQNIVGMKDEQSYALDRKIETLRQAYPNASEEQLRRMALGAVRPITDPVRGTTEIIDVLGEYLAAPVEPEKTPEQVAAEAREIADAEREATFATTDDDVAAVDRRLTNATGSVEQFFARGANKLSGLLGTAAFFPGVEASASALDLIRRDMARQIATDEGNRLLVTIYRDALEDMPDWNTSDSKALSLSQENIRRMDEGIANARGILASDTATAKMKSDAERAITSLQENRRRLYDLVRGTASESGAGGAAVRQEPADKDSTEWRIWYYNYGPGAIDGDSP
jgi:hypothetical protein